MTGENPCHERLGCPLFVNDQATGGIVRRPYPAMPSCSSPISGRAVDVAKVFQRIIAIVVPYHPVARSSGPTLSWSPGPDTALQARDDHGDQWVKMFFRTQ